MWSLQSLATAGRIEGVIRGDATTTITAVTERHDRVEPGGLFAVIAGDRFDGRRYLPQVIASDAAALLVDSELAAIDLPQLVVPNVREALGRAAQTLAGHPSGAMNVVGITGTDGKTTTAWFLRSLLAASDTRSPVGLVSTTDLFDGVSWHPATYTTPPAEELAGWLATMRRHGCRHAVVELSSQALDQRRAAGLELTAAIWTSFARDHLDAHGSEAAYFEAKARIASLIRPGADGRRPLIVPLDLPSRRRLSRFADLLTFADGGESADACFRITRCGRVELLFGGEAARCDLPFMERYNQRNALAAALAAACCGVPIDAIASACERLTLPRGRRQEVACDLPGVRILVDYAHTPHALAAIVLSLPSPLVVVVGAGGDRDPGKRPLMGEALNDADHVVLTSDNPRSESATAICEQIASTMTVSHEIILDRRDAIRAAIARAEATGGTVLIAGKGHETTQTIGGVSRPFDDAAVAAELLADWEPDDA